MTAAKRVELGENSVEILAVIPAAAGWYAKFKDENGGYHDPIPYFILCKGEHGEVYTEAPLVGEVSEYFATQQDGFDGFIYSPGEHPDQAKK